MILLSRVGGYGERNNLQPIWTGWCLGNCRAILVRKWQTKIWYQWCFSKGQISNLWTSRQLIMFSSISPSSDQNSNTHNISLSFDTKFSFSTCFSWVQFHTPHHVKNMSVNFIATVLSSKRFSLGFIIFLTSQKNQYYFNCSDLVDFKSPQWLRLRKWLRK